MLSLLGWAADKLYLPLLALFLLVAHVARTLITLFYRLFPFPSMVRGAAPCVCRSLTLRTSTRSCCGSFSRATLPARSARPSVAWTLRGSSSAFGFRCAHHQVVTADGFVLGLHRIVAPSASSEPAEFVLDGTSMAHVLATLPLVKGPEGASRFKRDVRRRGRQERTPGRAAAARADAVE